MSSILLIGEIGHNWNVTNDREQNIRIAIRLIEELAKAKWDIAKFQLYDVDNIKQPGDTNYEELKRAQLDFHEAVMLKQICDNCGIEFAASAFDEERVEWLERIKVKRHKLASRSIRDISLIKKMLSTGKPIIASLATWNSDQLPTFDADFLFCKSRRQILRDGFLLDDMPNFNNNDNLNGFSDHYVGNGAAIKAMESGARIIEKHVTLDKNYPGWDQPSSADIRDIMSIKYASDRIKKLREK